VGAALVVAVAIGGGACGGGGAPAAAPSGPPPAESSSSGAGADAGVAPSTGTDAGAPSSPPRAAARTARDLLTTCAVNDAGLCLPDPAFVARLCDGSFPDAALVLLDGRSPFSRAFVRGEREGWNADVGKSARAMLRDQEEVLVLKRRLPPKNGIVVGAGGGYLVMRWDGNCYTLEDGEASTTRPAGAPRTSPIAFHLLETPTRDKLLASPKVLTAFQKRGRECKGVTRGDVSKACEVADAALTTALVGEVRGGVDLPTPTKVP